MDTGLKGKTVLIAGTIEVERDAFQKPKGLQSQQPIRRLGKPKEVVSLMMYLIYGRLYFH